MEEEDIKKVLERYEEEYEECLFKELLGEYNGEEDREIIVEKKERILEDIRMILKILKMIEE